ncbi:MAG: cyclic nucleotide-binding domain-containing protein [Candidatus Sericytochromatia bacterium]
MQNIQALLKQVPFFSDFPPHKLNALSQIGTMREFQGGTVVFNEGDKAEDLFLILEGEVEILGQNPEGEKVFLTSLGAGQFFGELALADGGLRTATVFARTPCRFFTISREVFVQQLAASPELLSEVISAISQKIRVANRHYFEEQLQKQHLQLKMEQAQRQTTARMVSGVIRELHQPLDAFRQLSEQLDAQMNQLILAGQNGPAGALEELNGEFQTGINRMELLLQSFKSISPTEIFASLETVHWPAFWQELRAIYQASSFRELNLDIQMTSAAEAHPWRGYPHRLMEIMMHLLLNAEQHAYRDNDGPIEVRLALLGEGEANRFFSLMVRDHGAGIAPEHLQLVRDPFYTTDPVATGLGLAVSDNLVSTALGGKMQIESTLGQGTVVKLTFPVEAPKMSY